AADRTPPATSRRHPPPRSRCPPRHPAWYLETARARGRSCPHRRSRDPREDNRLRLDRRPEKQSSRHSPQFGNIRERLERQISVRKEKGPFAKKKDPSERKRTLRKEKGPFEKKKDRWMRQITVRKEKGPTDAANYRSERKRTVGCGKLAFG